MINLLIGTYNNYFNRIVKKENTDFSYFTVMGTTTVIKNINFNPNDGIETQIILGKGDYLTPESASNPVQPDYAILFKTQLENPPYSDAQIISRWFIIESVRTRSGQYQLTLKRDILVDYFNDVKSAPCFIEKATIDDTLNYLLYNSENYQVNQIKQAESLIKDSGKIAWVVGYVASNLASNQGNGNLGTIALNGSGQASGTSQLSNTNYTSFYITKIGEQSAQSGFTYTWTPSTKTLTYAISNSSLANQSVILRYYSAEPAVVSGPNYSVSMSGSQTRTHLVDAPYDMFCIPYGQIHLQSANINTDKDAAIEIAMEMSKDLGSNLYDIQLLPYCPRQDMLGTEKILEVLGVSGYDYNYIYKGSSIKSILIWCKKSTFNITATAENDGFSVPRPLEATERTADPASYTNSRHSGNSSAASLTFYDDNFKTRVVTNITSFTATYNGTTDSGITPTSFSQNMVSGSLTINYAGSSLPTGSYTVSSTLNYKYKNYENPLYLDYKISNECDLYRLVSPNYNGQFEWSIAKSVGNAKFFDIDCTYKPYQPYIHVSPQFSMLYGQDFNDARGLICGGDFSLPVTSDAWTQYQIQNKTYQDMFDRQIKHMDKQWALESNRNALAGVIGIGQGALIGGAAGGKAGGPTGAVLGAVGGTALSTLGMVADTIYNQDMYSENRSFAYDQFNLGLQNIQALPYGLTKVAAYTANNKIFPMIEYYTCSDIEKQAFKNKLTYNGMSINIIGKIEDFTSNNEVRFIKGQIIRLPSLKEDSHVANEIYNEINKGVYI